MEKQNRERDNIKALFAAWKEGRVTGYYIAQQTGINAGTLKRYKDDPDLLGRMSLEKAEQLSDFYLKMKASDFKK